MPPDDIKGEVSRSPNDTNGRAPHLRSKAARAAIATRLLEIGAECAALAAETPEGRGWLAKDYNDELYDEWGLPK